MNNNYAPIVLFVYNRLDHTKRVIEYLKENELASESELFIFSDADANTEQQDNVCKVREYIHTITGFKEIHIIEAEKNRGLAESIIYGVSEVIKDFKKVIVLEDDLIVSRDFLNYMNSALEFYKDISNIWSISGYTFPMKALDDYQHDVYVALRGCSWGWGTWIDRWMSIDWEVGTYYKVKDSIRNRIDFGRWGRDMPFILDENIYGMNHSWAIRWCYSAYEQQKYTIYPVVSRVKNIGTDGSGTNYKKVIHRYDTSINETNRNINFEMVAPDPRIEIEFRRKYKRILGVIRDHIKWTLIKKGIISVRKITK